MDQLRELTDAILSELKEAAPARQSVEWYLANNLEVFREVLLKNPNRAELAAATAALSRFCTDSMEWKSELFGRVTKITDLGARLSKK
jgi:hypothetical protein